MTKIKFRSLIVIIILFSLLCLGFSCGDDSDDNNISDDDNDSDNDDDNNTSDDDNDDDFAEDIEAEVTVFEPPEGNLLGRRVLVTTSKPCILSGRVNTASEPGYGPSTPVKSTYGQTHEFWFFGLLENQTFEYRFFLEDNSKALVAKGTFDTPLLPTDKVPEHEILQYNPDDEFTDWYMVNYHDRGDDVSTFMIYDRQGRIRYFHFVTDRNRQWGQVLSDGSIAAGIVDNIWGYNLEGSGYILYSPILSVPHIWPTHHKFYLPDDGLSGATVLYAHEGPGVECDLVTPTNHVVGDGIAEIDWLGNEVWRWSVFDHLDDIPVATTMNVEHCESSLYGSTSFDWTHGNSVIPYPGEDAYLVSFRNLSRVIKINKATGDIEWQMGQGLDFEWIGDQPEEDKWFRFQHDAVWLEGDRLLVYDNGACRLEGQSCFEGPYSRALELQVDLDNMTVEQIWEHRHSFHSPWGSVIRHENGNTLTSAGSREIFYESLPNGDEEDDIFVMKVGKGTVRAEYYKPLWVYEPD